MTTRPLYINVYDWLDPKFADDPTSAEIWYSREAAKDDVASILDNNGLRYLYTLEIAEPTKLGEKRQVKFIDLQGEIEIEREEAERSAYWERRHENRLRSPFSTGRI